MATVVDAAQAGEPLQIVQLNADENKVEVNQEAMAILKRNLEKAGSHKVAIVAVMGAFRTGKSFLLDLFLRYLRHQDASGEEDCRAQGPPPRESEEQVYPLPPWMGATGALEGHKDESAPSGFRFKGGMDACTEGVWIWSQPFMRTLNGERVALLLMDTQGAWDSELSQEQSATIFGLTAVLSSKLVYNVNMQIQEDKVENLAFFMNFAQAALRRAANEDSKVASEGDTAMTGKALQDEIETPFQTLDFLVRDWKNYRDGASVDDCLAMAKQHLDKHVNPAKRPTADSLKRMFRTVDCMCLPHPGLKIEKEAWTGQVQDIDRDFIRFVDMYVHRVFNSGLDTKKILGGDITTRTFVQVCSHFVEAFQDAAPAAVGFAQAIQLATCLASKEKAMETYVRDMDQMMGEHQSGLDEAELMQQHLKVFGKVEQQFKSSTIFGDEDALKETWGQIEGSLIKLKNKYMEDNNRKLERALAQYASITVLAVTLFLVDLASDWLVDWWCPMFVQISRVLLLGYVSIAAFIGFHVFQLYSSKGKVPTLLAAGELWKEAMRLTGAYLEVAQHTKSQLQRSMSGTNPGEGDGADKKKEQ